jgi:mannose-1-phosphate guanylyltransferase
MAVAVLRPLRCGIVMAGGEGKRLQAFIRRLLSFDLPKQYVSFIGTRSMLEHTFDRVGQLIPPERIFTVLARDHFKYAEVRRQIGARPPHTAVLQPINRETAPGLLLPLMYLLKRYPNSTVAVFPSDHFVLQEDLFAAYVKHAFETVERNPAKIVFLGVEPSDPEPEYGYILPESQDSDLIVQGVKTFVEKPDPQIAARIISTGALWNTMVMVFKPEILLHLISLSAPKLYHSFQQIFQALGTFREPLSVEKIYRHMEPSNFSKDLLEGLDLYSRNQLSVVPMKGVFWSDWGSGDRIISVLEKLKDPNRLLGELGHKKDPDRIPTIVGAGLRASL